MVKADNKMKLNKISNFAFDAINYFLLALMCVVMLYPFIYILALSFNDGVDTLKGGIWLFPRVFSLINYKEAFQDKYIFNSFLISVSRTVIGTVLSLMLTSMLAYGLLDKKMKGRRFLIIYIFITTLFSGGIIPFFILMRDLKLLDNFWIYILPAIYNFYNFIIVRAAFEAVPYSLEEACRIDGADDTTIFLKVYMPLSMPALATIALFFGVFHWNDWFAGVFYVSDKALKPAASLLQEIIANAASDNPDLMNTALGQASIQSTPQSLQMAFVVILVFPIVCLYPFLQKYYINSVTIGSIKE